MPWTEDLLISAITDSSGRVGVRMRWPAELASDRFSEGCPKHHSQASRTTVEITLCSHTVGDITSSCATRVLNKVGLGWFRVP